MAQGSTARSWARGGTIFAATVLLLVGVYQIFLGIAAIVQNDFFVVGANYAYKINTTAWGWIHLGIGALAAVTGFFLFTGQLWARVVGIAMASISAIANFFFLPYYPLWSSLIIGLDIFAIWAIANVRREQMTAMEAEAGMYRGDYTQTGERWPATNQPAGRHWAGEPAKEGVGRSEAAQREAAQREAAEAMSRPGGMGQQGTQQSGMPPSSGTGQSGMPRDPQGPTP